MNDTSIVLNWRAARSWLLTQGSDKDSLGQSTLRLPRAYEGLSAEERKLLQPLIDEWTLSERVGERIDARAITRRNSIEASLPALRQLAERLEGADDIHETNEWTRVNQLVGFLLEPSHLG